MQYADFANGRVVANHIKEMPLTNLRLALMGAGNVAAKYAAALAGGRIAEARLVGVVAPHPEKAAAFAQEHGILQHAPNLRLLLDKTPFDAVIVATPSGLHGQCAIEAALLKKHVLCEKPLEITLAKIDQMVEACRQAGVKLACTFQHRTAEHNRLARELVRAGKLGRIFIANAFLKNYRAQEYYQSGSGWRGTWQLDGGGPFMQQAAHTIDLMVWMMGPARRVCAVTKTVDHEIEVEDLGHAIVEYENGAQGVLEASTVVRPGYPNKIEIHGEKGTIILSEEGVVAWEVPGEPMPALASAPRGSGAADPMAIGVEGHELILRDFASAVTENRPPLVPPQSARLSVALILAIYKSAKEKRWITI